jgi:starvation-inducible DNA-binding protein
MEPNNDTTTVSGEEVAILLQPILADVIALTLHAKQAHWHVQGRHFTPIHQQLDDLVADLRHYSDELAERVVALGTAVDGRPQTVSETSQVRAGQPGFTPDDKVIDTIVGQLGDAVTHAREAVAPLESVDLVTQDLVIEVVRVLEKHRWMFDAQAHR